MNRSYFQHLLLAAVLSLIGGMLLVLLPLWMEASAAATWTLGVLSIGYILFVLVRSEEHRGRIIVASAAAGVLLGTSLVSSVFVVACVSLLLVSVTRALYHYPSVGGLFVDLTVTGLGAGFAVWAFASTSSVVISLWCFFLAQSLTFWIPTTVQQRSTQLSFRAAQDQATTAMRALAKQQTGASQ